MATKCGFCENKLKANEGYNVKEVVIDKSPGIIKLTDVLLDLYLCELDVSKICAACMDKISKQFIFKQELRKKNKNMPQLNLIIQISKFFSKTKESIAASEHLDVLSIYPERRKQFVETIKNFSPEVRMSSKPPEQQKFLKTEAVSLKINDISSRRSDIKTVTFAANTSFIKSNMTSSSESESDDSNYGDKKSRKRNKKTKTSGNAKKHKSGNNSFIVKEEPIPTEIITASENEGNTKLEFRDPLSIQQLEQSRESSLLNTSGLNLSVEQLEWLNSAIETTERCGLFYSCKFCFKELKSAHAVRYHYISAHLIKKITKKKVWVRQKIKEGIFQVTTEDGRKMTNWKCTECLKVYTNQPGIRYHLTKHLQDDFDESIDTSLK